MSVKARVSAGVVVLVVLFLAVIVTQLLVSDRLQADHARHTERLVVARTAHTAALQHLTDAETGVRGFQLTGDTLFLEPYEQGRVGAFTAFDEVAAASTDENVLRLVAVERAAAAHWLSAYAYPVVNAGASDPDRYWTVRGKEMFDRIRAASAAADAALRAEQQAIAAADRRQSQLAQLFFALLATAFLAVIMLFASSGRRLLLAPLEHMRVTLRRLAAGELSARAVPSGPGEMRAVIGSLNRLAAETERLLAADGARIARSELRQSVAGVLRDEPDPVAGARRVAALIGEALDADAVHGHVSIGAADSIAVSWPPDAPSLSSRTVQDVLAGRPGVVMVVPHLEGALAVPMGGDSDCPPGLLYIVRHDHPEWTEDERRVLATLAREVDHAVRQLRLQHRQARLIRELRVLDERKDAFVATVTHELRTPLSSILGYTEMLADGDGGELSPLQQRGVTAILRNAHRLQDTVADLLLLDRVNSAIGDAVPVDLAAVAATLHAEFLPVARGREVALSGGAERVWVSGDARQLERALRNLLDNAMKFTGAGGSVDCRVHVKGDAAVLTVTDTGIGIPGADLPGLFTPFHRAANAMDRAVQGSGLGLAIVRTIVTEHGGTVAAESVLGRGSTLTVTLPAVPPPPP